MKYIFELVHAAVDYCVVFMANQAHKHHCDVKVKVNEFVWLLSEHLHLAPSLSC